MRILSFDGGGIRGLIPLLYIKNLLKVYPDFLDKIDAYAGTSTGGIIAIMLASNIPIDTIIDLYVNKGKDIFSDSLLDDVGDLFGLKGAQYNQEKLKHIAWNLLGNDTLGDLKKKVLIPTFCLDNKLSYGRSWCPRIYDNFDDKYKDEALWEIALKTSAAPIYFPSYKNYIDGGMIANNPSMCILAECIKQDYKDVKLISFGNGEYKKYINKENINWGLIQWAPHLINIIMDGGLSLTDYQCQQILKDKYLRIQPEMIKEFKLDGVDEIPEMIETMTDWPIHGDVISFLENFWV